MKTRPPITPTTIPAIAAPVREEEDDGGGGEGDEMFDTAVPVGNGPELVLGVPDDDALADVVWTQATVRTVEAKDKPVGRVRTPAEVHPTASMLPL